MRQAQIVWGLTRLLYFFINHAFNFIELCGVVGFLIGLVAAFALGPLGKDDNE